MTEQTPTAQKQPNVRYIFGLTIFVIIACGYLPLWLILFNVHQAQQLNSDNVSQLLLSMLAVSPWIGLTVIPAILAGLLILAFRRWRETKDNEILDDYFGILLTAFGVASTSYIAMFALLSQIAIMIPSDEEGLLFTVDLFGCPSFLIFFLLGLQLALLPKSKNLKGWYGIGLFLTFILPTIIFFLTMM